MNSVEARGRLFQAACRRAEWTVHQLWRHYLALGGVCDVFELDAFLHDLAPLAAGEQDVLAIAVNERLDDRYRAAKVPYLIHPEPAPPGAPAEDPLQILDALLRRISPDDPAVDDNAVGDSAVPDQAVPDQAIPDQAIPDQAVPDQAVPNSTAPDSMGEGPT